MTPRREHVVKKCRRCGKAFSQLLKPSPYKVAAGSDAYVLHSYCENCRNHIRARARLCDPRYAGVGGHGDLFHEN